MTSGEASGQARGWESDPALPVEGSVELPIAVDALWRVFVDVRRWPRWNRCFWVATVTQGSLRAGATLLWAFNPIERRYLYKLPAIARLAEVVPARRVTWEVTLLPGFFARHTYWMEPVTADRCRFGSWEIAEGPMYRLGRNFWLAHFEYVCRESLRGARSVAQAERGRARDSWSEPATGA